VPFWGTVLMVQVCLVAVLTGAGRPAATKATVPGAMAASTPWGTVWYENFSGRAGSGVSAKNWAYQTGQGIFGNNEVEDMTSSPGNVHLDGAGNLDITALHQGGTWTSGRIRTTQQFGAPAGGELRVIASIRQPGPASGLGYWPAFWLLGPGAWPQDGEIDILEDVNTLSEHSGTLHCGNLTTPAGDGTFGPCHEHTGLSSGLLPCGGCQTGYHTYSVIIDRRVPADEHIYWYLDGREFFSMSESQIGAQVWAQAVDHGFSIILDLAMGGAYPDGVCGCTTPTGTTTSGGAMSVRYVGVYRR
jgi:beta-glucanase (GH16 family)